jgi:hypothetical protein
MNFNFEKDIKENIKNELDLVILVELNNYIYYIFNHIYIRTIIFIINILLYRNYRILKNWYIFFRFDHILQGKRSRNISKIFLL